MSTIPGGPRRRRRAPEGKRNTPIPAAASHSTRVAVLDGQAKIDAEKVLAGWAQALEAGVLVVRQALRKLLAGPIVVTT